MGILDLATLPPTSHAWLGTDFGVYDPDASWYDKPGVYVFASWLAWAQRWLVLYVGKTDSFKERFESHEKWPEAVSRGATHVHAVVSYDPMWRIDAEAELIRVYDPPLNKVQPSGGLLGAFLERPPTYRPGSLADIIANRAR